jgi:hypothetical protein
VVQSQFGLATTDLRSEKLTETNQLKKLNFTYSVIFSGLIFQLNFKLLT